MRLIKIALRGIAAVCILGRALPVLAAGDLAISQVYGGGGNTGAPFTHDYVEIFNRGSSPVSLNGLSLQYASATGTGNLGANATQLTELPDVTLAPGQYFLVAQASGANGVPLPTPDLVDPTPIAMAAGAGKVALVTGTLSLGCNGGSTPCDSAALARILDLVGYGNANFFEGGAAAPTLSNTTAALRGAGGCIDTDVNSADFASGAPTPRNGQSAANLCGGGDTAPSVSSTSPAAGAQGVPVNAVVTIAFSEPVDVAGAWFGITCSTSGDHTATVSGGPSTYTLDPDVDFLGAETCTITVAAAQVTDQDLQDPPDSMAADHVFGFETAAGCGSPADRHPHRPGQRPGLAPARSVRHDRRRRGRQLPGRLRRPRRVLRPGGRRRRRLRSPDLGGHLRLHRQFAQAAPAG